MLNQRLQRALKIPLGTVALRVHAEGRPKHHIQIKSKLEERSTMKITWQCTNDTIFVTMLSLAAAKLQIQCLNLFGDTDMKLFALASDQLNLIDWDRPDIAHVLATVISLNTNISTRVFAFKDRGGVGKRLATQIGLKESQTGQRLRFALELKTKAILLALQDLSRNVLGFKTLHTKPLALPRLPELKDFQFPNWKILKYVSELPSLPKLNRYPRKFKHIFEFCSSPESNMQKLEVRAPLYQMGPEERGQIHFQRQQYDEDAECCAHLRRQGEGVRRPIHFHSDPQTSIEVGTSFLRSM
ncbi:hypothetical protein FDENT_1212 [Fusarium denticulatum]|uniref:Uncharacterized protein n=1 Tax=Fusarium denticulatum TaxID=48507 RepID=A0A8H6CVA6_9HYPO|nr:hypothetical protein FDENT_1212 [Fusarium denticulatum]